MRNIVLEISYNGKNFCGWQKQDGMRTVQGEIESCLEKLHKVPTVITGSGRTDSGVHAVGQVANFSSPVDTIPVDKYPIALNSLLAKDVRIMSSRLADEHFHARFSATKRTYRYMICCSQSPFAHESDFVWHIHRYPNLARLNEMAACLHGEQDFTTFSASGDLSPSKCRYIEKAVFYYNGDKLVFEICANAFLWKMVRSLTGSLLYYEKKGFGKKEFTEILNAKDRSLAGPTAPAQGLFLWSVSFDGIRRGPKINFLQDTSVCATTD